MKTILTLNASSTSNQKRVELNMSLKEAVNYVDDKYNIKYCIAKGKAYMTSVGDITLEAIYF